MTTIIVTIDNWDDPAFWESFSLSDSREHTLDLSALPGNFFTNVSTDAALGNIAISDGTTNFLIGDSQYAGPSQATLQGSSHVYNFTTVLGGQGTAATGNDSDNVWVGSGEGEMYTGGAGVDNTYSGGGDDTIIALGGNDRIDAGAGNDSIEGNMGDDLIDGGTGVDTIHGGEGNDTINAGTDAGYVTGGAGDDFISVDGGTRADKIDGGSGDDVININEVDASGSTDKGFVAGGDGSDTINITDSNIGTIYGSDESGNNLGGAGYDTFNVSGDSEVGKIWTGFTSDPTGGKDVINISDNSVVNAVEIGPFDQVVDINITGSGQLGTETSNTSDDDWGGAQNISVKDEGVIDSSDIFSTGAGNDTLNFFDESRAETALNAGTGDDVITFSGLSSTDDAVSGGDGNDTIIVEDTAEVKGLISGNAGDDSIIGGVSNNIIHGGSGNDTLSGGTGDDYLQGDDGNDSIDAGDGIDTVYGGAGDDTVTGGTGDDFIYGWSGKDSLSGGAGNDSIDGGTDDDFIDGGADDDLLYGGVGQDTLYGGEGDDEIGAGAGDDVLFGEEGSDTLYGDVGNDTIDGGDGNDAISGGEGDDSIIGGCGADSIYGNAGDDTIDGGDDADTLYGGTGNDSLSGGEGNDLLYASAGNDTLLGGDGNDYLSAGDDDDLIDGGEGNDHIDGGYGNDIADGGAGDDDIDGEQGNDLLTGGTGNDTISGGSGDDTIDSGIGNDVIYAGLGDDSVDAGAGIDYIELSGGNDTVFAGDDADNIRINAGNYEDGAVLQVDGGNGGNDLDVLDLRLWAAYRNLELTRDADDNSNSGAVELLDDNGNWITLNFSEIEIGQLPDVDMTSDYIVSGTSGDDLIDSSYSGDPDGDRVDSADGPSAARPDDDIIHAGDGNDTVFAGLGDDSVLGGEGNDSLQGDDGNDHLEGEVGDDIILGGVGADTIYGGDGEDTVHGGDNSDVIYGGDGNDILYGDGANDSLSGGTGDDTMYGGDGRDVFSVEDNSGTDTIEGGEGGDDFDKINFRTAETDGVSVTFTGDEAGTYTTATGDGSFSEIEAIDGNRGRDTIDATASSADMVLNGREGNDTIIGGSGDDSLLGHNDADMLLVHDNDGVDTIDGGGGGVDADTLGFLATGSEGVDVSYTGDEAGSYTFDADGSGTFAEIEALQGSSQGDTIDGSATSGGIDVDAGAGDDTVTGGSGNDLLAGGTGADSILGGAGNDQLEGGAGNDYLQGDDGDDTLDGGAGDDTIIAGYGNDKFIVSAGDDSMQGNWGDDTFVVGDDVGNSTLNGGFLGETDGDTLTFAQSNTTGVKLDLSHADSETGSFTIGTNTSEFIGIDNIVLGSGTDTVTLADGSGADTVSGFEAPTENPDGTFAGNDQLDVAGLTSDGGTTPINTGDVTVTGSGGVDGNGDPIGDAVLTFAGGESITLLGVDPTAVSSPAALAAMGIPVGRDGIVEGTADDDRIDSDYIDTDGDRVDNADAVDPAAGPDDDVIHAGGGNDLIYSNFGDDSVLAGTGNDFVYAGGGDDTVEGGEGNDTLYGSTGEDSILGGDGGDLIRGGEDADKMDGGDGFDTLDYSNAPAAVNVNLETETASGSHAQGDEFTNFEGVRGGLGDDTLTGDDNHNLLAGGAGHDTIVGAAGNDQLSGDAGDDTMLGGLGNDSLYGGAGNDSLEGGDGNDLIHGHGDDDSLLGGAGDDMILVGGGQDTVDAGTGNDQIFLSNDVGDNTVDGGTDSDGDYDRLMLTQTDADHVIDLSGTDEEAGTVVNQDNGSVTTFTEIETISLGSGTDTLKLADGGGDRVVKFFEAPTDNGDGTFTGNDMLDVTGLTVDGTDPIHTGNVLVTPMSSGTSTLLTFPSGETLYLNGTVLPSDPGELALALNAMGVPLATPDYSVEGTSGNDTIDASYAGDPDGDMIDADDNLAGNSDDLVQAGEGDDQVASGLGDDTLQGEDGNDTLDGGTGDDLLAGGEGDDTFIVSEGNDTISDFNTGNTGAIDDGDQTNNDFVDLSGHYDNIFELRADQADDGLLNQSNTDADYSDNAQFDAVNNLTLLGVSAGDLTYDNTNVACFTTGTAIRTPDGDKLIETLKVGDLVDTADNGPQPLRWIGMRKVDETDLATAENLRPVLINAHVLGNTKRLIVSQQHGMLIDGNRLARAKHLAETMKGVRIMRGKKSVCYIHLMFDTHQIIFAENSASESFYPGPMALNALNKCARSELLVLFPELQHSTTAAPVTRVRPLVRNTDLRAACRTNRMTGLAM